MSDTVIKLTPMKKSMARHMTESWDGVPQFNIEGEIDCRPMIKFRGGLPFKTSYTTLIVRAAALCLKKHPGINASFGQDHILCHEGVNIGVAADTGKGLLVPVIRDAADKTIRELHECMEEIKEKTKRGNFTLEQLAGGTFTISNLGMFPVSAFTAIVNAPQAAIMALARMRDVPVVKNGTIVCGKQMNVRLSADHRITAGADLARFMADFIVLLEEPENLL
ncbi:MAG: Dihydrolipoyllysine-residue succinyltransferase component of 2-oxoglutarate dehydrogenase complex [Desulfovibrio sp.]|uniref:2-oxo acid dehydrogenase subunit E2 n=1 Tax=Christensenella intestinihominis TaxID=1851429 RepID=UPI0008295D97|nr:2-oxo acid dehydrogenase subunit E2 [Christensenella intestinihominis]